MSSTVTGNPSINSGSMHDPTAVSGNERREFVNMFGTGQSNYTFVVNEETGTIFQVTIDDDGTFNDRIPVGSAIKFKDASGNSASLPGMYNDQGEVVSGGIEAQTRQVFVRLQQALALAGCTLNDVCKVSVWLNDARDFGSFNRVYMECFGEHRPARSTVESRLMIDAKVEIDVTAYKPRA